MTKKGRLRIPISVDFWKGLIAGMILALFGAFLYFRLYPTDKLPPTNSSLAECQNNCRTRKGACLVQCGTGDTACQDRCDNGFKICTMRCYPH